MLAPVMTTPVPDVRRLSVADAREAAKRAGLGLESTGAGPGDEARAVVVSQSPDPGSRVARGTTMRVVAQLPRTDKPPAELSPRGPATREPGRPRVDAPAPKLARVPELRKQTLLAARALAESAGVTLSTSRHPAEEEGRLVVVAQRPEAGAVVAVGSPVAVQLERSPAGSETTVVPELRKRKLAEARAVLERARLNLAAPGGTSGDERQLVVVEQKPVAGTEARVGSSVAVWVERAPTAPPPAEYTVVPELRRLALSAAQARLEAARLSLRLRSRRPPDPSRAVVVQQDPPAGARVVVGSAVAVSVDVAAPEPPDVARVPDLRRRLLPEARGLVERERLVLQAPRHAPDEERHLVVVAQDPGPGTRVAVGSAVAVQVDRAAGPAPGPPSAESAPPGTTTPAAPVVSPSDQTPPLAAAPVVPPSAAPAERPARVPSLVDRTMDAARELVRASQLGLRIAGERPPDSGRAIVASQEPAPGTEVSRGATVTVVLRALPERVRVPALVSLTLDEARAHAGQARLELDVAGEQAMDGRWTRVASQEPLPGREVEVGSRVRVQVEPVLVDVPDLREGSVADARRLTGPLGLGLELMGRAPEDEARAIISEQHPPPGTRRPAGSAVVVKAAPRGLPMWAWVALVTAGLGAAGGAAAGAVRSRVHARRAEPPPLRVEVGGQGWWQESAAEGPVLALPALALRVSAGSTVQTVEEDLSIVAEERNGHEPG